ncbi:MAG: XdhC family protein, partial [Anaerolineales bacterium]|nr:XdhC family protein [Anaerolineales bacterium]
MSIYKELAKIEETNQSGALCTIIRSEGSTPRHEGSKMLVYSNGETLGSIGGGEVESRVIAEALQSMIDRKSRLLTYNLAEPDRGDPGVCGGQLQIYIEPIIPKEQVIIIGAGHVGKAIAHLAHWLGFYVVISDDRAQFCNPETIPDGDEFYPVPLKELPKQIEITSSSYLVMPTRSMEVDLEGLPELLDTTAAYIGVIGSRRRWAVTREKLIDIGVNEEKIARVRSPMGLNLKAEKP